MQNMMCDNNNVYLQLDITIEEKINKMKRNEKIKYLFMKMINYIDKTSIKYILWYTPNNFNIKNYDKFYEVITNMNNDLYTNISNINPPIKNLYVSIKNIINNYARDSLTKYNFIEYTNFTQIYQEASFVHNIRHIWDYKDEIDIIIHNMYKFKQPIFKKYYLVFAHYPNDSEFNIFHMHTYSKVYDSGERTIERYINFESGSRSFIWHNQLKYYDFSNTTILLRFRGECCLEDILKKFDRSNLLK
jgi:hypothetical protein